MSTETLVAQVKPSFIMTASDSPQSLFPLQHLTFSILLWLQMRLGGEEKVFGCITPALYPSTTYERDVDGSYSKGKWWMIPLSVTTPLVFFFLQQMAEKIHHSLTSLAVAHKHKPVTPVTRTRRLLRRNLLSASSKRVRKPCSSRQEWRQLQQFSRSESTPLVQWFGPQNVSNTDARANIHIQKHACARIYAVCVHIFVCMCFWCACMHTSV